nr:hypothetical protein [Tanacetum cinerariifolium]
MSTENGVNPPTPNPAHNSNFSLLLFLVRERLTGPNYMDWMRNLRFTLRYENKEYVLDEKIPTIDDDSTQEEIEAHQKHYDDANKVSCIMASSMRLELQKTFENTWSYEMNQQLKEMFQAKASKEYLNVVKSVMAYKPKPGASICAFVLEMKGYFNILKSLNMVFDVELSINIILSGLPADYNQFVLSYQMNEKETSIMKLHSFTSKTERLKRVVTQGLKESKKLKHGELNLVMGNRKITPVTKIGKKIKVLRSDKGGEYLSIEFFDHLKTPRTPQLNGVAERRHKTLLDMVRSMISQATLPISFWGYALETAAHILNLIPTKKVSKTPFEMRKGKRPSLEHIKIWGCEDNVVFVARRGVFLKREMISKEDGGINKPPQFYYGFHIEEDKISDSILSELDEPANYKEAMASLEAAK